MEYYLIECARQGDLDAFKEREKYLRNHPNCLHAQSEAIFLHACHFGKLHVAKWLWEFSILIHSPIDINIKLPYAEFTPFIEACVTGELEVAKWLYDICKEINNPVDIHLYDDKAFRLSCEKGKKNIAEWLCSLYPGYQMTYKSVPWGWVIDYNIIQPENLNIDSKLDICNEKEIVEV
jgi:hypothetical protein